MCSNLALRPRMTGIYSFSNHLKHCFVRQQAQELTQGFHDVLEQAPVPEVCILEAVPLSELLHFPLKSLSLRVLRSCHLLHLAGLRPVPTPLGVHGRPDASYCRLA